MEIVLSILIGISLSATSGFRIFVPFLVLSIASLGGWIELTPSFDWIGTYPVMAALLIATIIETVAYFFPYVDNLLAALATPLSILAGIIITVSVMVDLPPMLAWVLAIIAGGGAALGGNTISNALHAGSTVTTGGVANPAVSFFESVLAAFLSIMAVVLPVITALLLIVATIIIIRAYRNRTA
jgi:hypothetical protein